MSIYNRPLFRQVGGPAQMMPSDMAQMQQPPMPPQPMAAQQPQGIESLKAQVGQVESDTAAQAEQVGAQYAQDTMDNLDSAQDPKGIIDALRGNQKSLEDRYMELAQYVGQDDAMKTPESVLAMVQPTLMMTEQGAVDTGIGELMQGITSDVSMESPDGQPTQMAEGVGSLMMQGVGQQPHKILDRAGL